MSTVMELGYGQLDYFEIVFPRLGIDVTIDPTAFSLFGIDIQWYGLIITFGLILALIYAFRNMQRVGLDPDRTIDAIIGGIIGGLVGARTYYVILNWEDYAGDWAAIFNTRSGGLAIYGGLIGAVLVGSIIAKLRKVRLLPLLDLCGVGFLIGQGIGRWGNFVNQEAFGTNTDSLFCMTGGRIQAWILDNYTATSSLNSGVVMDANIPVHPCFLYESVWCLVGAVLLMIVMHRGRKFDGQIILMYMGWYGLGRFFIEGIRTDSLMIGTLRISQLVAAICVIVSVVLLIVCSSKVSRMGYDYVLYCNSKECMDLYIEAQERMELEAEKRRLRKEKRKAGKNGETAAADTQTAENETEETENKELQTEVNNKQED